MVGYNNCKNILSQFQSNLKKNKFHLLNLLITLSSKIKDDLFIGKNQWDLWWSHHCFISNKLIPSLYSKFFSSSVFCHLFKCAMASNIFFQYYTNLYIMCFLKAGLTLNCMIMYRGGFLKASNEPHRSINLMRQSSLRHDWHKHIPKDACISFLHPSISPFPGEAKRVRSGTRAPDSFDFFFTKHSYSL